MRTKNTFFGNNVNASAHRVGEPGQGLSLSVSSLWEVEAGESYENDRRLIKGSNPNKWVFIRTMEGKGELFDRITGHHELDSATWLLIAHDEIKRYHCCAVTKYWRFTWVEFSALAPWPEMIPLVHVHHAPLDPSETELIQEIRDSIESPIYHNLADSNMSRWIWKVLKGSQENKTFTPAQTIVQKASQWLSQHGDQFPTVQQLADSCFVSSRHLQASFQSVLQRSPKKYLEERQLNKVMHQLLCSSESIGEISRNFGYSSPYHLSQRFKKFYGYPPSMARKG